MSLSYKWSQGPLKKYRRRQRRENVPIMDKSIFRPRQSFQPMRGVLDRDEPADFFASRVSEFPAAVEGNSIREFVLYWAQMSRRLEMNPALAFAALKARELGLPLLVYESLRPDYREANDRIHTFILEGVERNRADASRLGLRYHFFLPRTKDQARGVLVGLSRRAAAVVTDEYPTFVARQQTPRLIAKSAAPVYLVDGNGIIPMRRFSKEQYSAKFLRDRAHRMFPESWRRLAPAVKVEAFAGEVGLPEYDGTDVGRAVSQCDVRHDIQRVPSIGGRTEGLRRLESFVDTKLDGYGDLRNREADRSSQLSPYLHFGFLGIHEVAERVLLSDAPMADIDAFLEEAIIRRELSFNFCFYREDHDRITSLPDWALKSLDRHRGDRRKPQYSFEELELGATYDEVWNLAHQGLLQTGTIHNYLRMIWGKKVLEWMETPEEAVAAMELLHDRYAIDGRDPNTYAGVLWCLGKHDRAWGPERPIFGSIRYMSSDSTRRKVDLRGYEEKISDGGVATSMVRAQANLLDQDIAPVGEPAGKPKKKK